MKKFIISIALSILSNLVLASSALAASALPVIAPASAEVGSRAADCDNATLRPEQFEVAIDRASGIAFVHTPCGWTYMGVVKRESIDGDIAMANAKPVPANVIAAEITLRPWLASFRRESIASRRSNAAPAN